MLPLTPQAAVSSANAAQCRYLLPLRHCHSHWCPAAANAAAALQPIMANAAQPKSARAQPKTQGCSPNAALAADMLPSLLHAAAAVNTAAAAAAAKAAAADAAACKFGLGPPSGHRRWHNNAVESVVCYHRSRRCCCCWPHCIDGTDWCQRDNDREQR
jgi:hypothetical protein